MEHYNKKGWMQPMGSLPRSLRTYGEIFGNVWVNEANTLNTTDLPKNLSEIKTEWNSYDLLGNYAYEIKINDSLIRDLIKVDIKYGQIVEGGPHVWYYVFKRADMELVKFIVSPWYVKKYNDLIKHPTMTDSQIAKKSSEYAAQRLAAQQLAAQQLAVQQQELVAQQEAQMSQGESGYEDPMDDLEALLDDLNERTAGHGGPETLSDRGLAADTASDSGRSHRAQISSGRSGGKTPTRQRAPLLPTDTMKAAALHPLNQGEAEAHAAAAARPGLAIQSDRGVMYGAVGGGRKRRYTKKIKRRSSKKRRSKKRKSKKRRSRR